MMTAFDSGIWSSTESLWESIRQPEYLQAAISIYQTAMNTPSVRDTCLVVYNCLKSIMSLTRFFCAVKTENNDIQLRAFIDKGIDQLAYLGREPDNCNLLADVLASKSVLVDQDHKLDEPIGRELEDADSWVLVPLVSAMGQSSIVIGACSDQAGSFSVTETHLLRLCAEAIMAVATRASVVDSVISNERERIMTEAAGDLLHEITNLLGTIPPYVDMITQMLDETSLSTIKQYLDSVRSDAIKVQTVCRSKLIDIRNQMGPSKMEPTDIVDVLESARAVSLDNRPDVHILRIETSPNIPRVLVRPRDLFEVFKEIIRNGLWAMKDSEERILTLRGKPWIDLNGKAWAQIEVEDTGCGIPESDLDRIWDLSYSTKTTPGGYGLYRAKSTIESFGGDIGVESQINVGTTFRIRLPGEIKP